MDKLIQRVHDSYPINNDYEKRKIDKGLIYLNDEQWEYSMSNPYPFYQELIFTGPANSTLEFDSEANIFTDIMENQLHWVVWRDKDSVTGFWEGTDKVVFTAEIEYNSL